MKTKQLACFQWLSGFESRPAHHLIAGRQTRHSHSTSWVPAVANLRRVIKSDYYHVLTFSELKRWLAKQGCTFVEGTKHTKVMLGGKATIMPRHPSQEVKTKTLKTILKELGLKM
jgi:mRNA interferase HicA